MEDQQLIQLSETGNASKRLITWDQAWQLAEIPNVAPRIKRDLRTAIQQAECYATGDWGCYHQVEPVDKSRIVFVLYNDEERTNKGKPFVECVVLKDGE